MVALTAGVFIGVLILNDYNLFAALFSLFEVHVFEQVGDLSRAPILIVMLMIGGFIQLLEKSGASEAFSNEIIKAASTSFRAQISAWVMGLCIFFTEAGNTLIIGPLFRPVFDKLGVCREKLAYVIDTTASPVSILVPVAGWGVYIMSLLDSAYEDLGLQENSFSVLLQVWPYQFYAILAVLSVPMVLSTGKDFGPMQKAQSRCAESPADSVAGYDSRNRHTPNERTIKTPGKSLFLMPLSVLCLSLAGFLIYFALVEDFTGIHIVTSIIVSYILASLVMSLLVKYFGILLLEESLSQFIKGMQNLLPICIVLVLAWTMSSVCGDLRTGAYVASLIGDNVSHLLLPVLVFFLGAVMSFATGSSFGTFAILLGIVIPVAHSLGAPLHITIAAVLSGGLFGDHTSPISDTTVLASMGAGCLHAEHVFTQVPYALAVGAVSIIAYLATSYFPSPWLLPAAVVLQFIVISLAARLIRSADSNLNGVNP